MASRRCVTAGEQTALVDSSSTGSSVEALEEARSAAEEHRHHVHLELVEHAGVQALLDHARAAGHVDVLAAGGRARVLERRLEPVGDEGEGGTTLLLDGLAGVVGEDEDRSVEGRIVSPPGVRVRVVLPRALAAAEHAPAHDDGADPALHLRDHVVVGSALAAGEAVGLAEALQPEGPLVQELAARAERMLQARVRPRDEAVEGHRDVADESGHAPSDGPRLEKSSAR